MTKLNAIIIPMTFLRAEQCSENNMVTFICSISDKTFRKIIKAKKYGSIKFLLPEDELNV